MDVARVQRLRSDLVSSDFTVERITSLWGPDAEEALHRGYRLPAERALAAVPPHRCATLARLLVLGLPVPRGVLDAALPELTSAGAEALHLVRVRGQAGGGDHGAAGGGPAGAAGSAAATARTSASVAATAGGETAAARPGDVMEPCFDLRPYAFADARGAGEWWILSDLGEASLGHALAEDHVLGIGGASLTLSGLILPIPAVRALDLGTGCGVQALHLSRQAEHVVATDISERAIRIARFNAALNGVDNIEFRTGDLFAPVDGEHFDLIVSNPPFVITPRADGVPAYEYRDGGLVGDALVEAVIRGCAERLQPGGVAQLLANWEDRQEPAGTVREGLERVREWVDAREESGADAAPGIGAGFPVATGDGADFSAATDGGSTAGTGTDGASVVGLDAWVVERERLTGPEYAETWIRDGGTRPGTPRFEELYRAWLDDFRARGVAGVGFGYVLLRRSGGPLPEARLRRFERISDVVGSNGTGLGSHLLQCLGLSDWQTSLSDQALADERLVVASDVTEERHYRPGEEDPSVIVLRQGGGFARAVRADTALAAAVGACDGSLPVGAISDAIAELLDVDPIALRVHLVSRIRALIDIGMLFPG